MSDEDTRAMAGLLAAMLKLPAHDAAGVSLSYLLHMVFEQPDMLRTLLNESVVREGFRGEPMIQVLTRAAR